MLLPRCCCRIINKSNIRLNRQQHRFYSSSTFNMDPEFILSTGFNQTLFIQQQQSQQQQQQRLEKSMYDRHNMSSITLQIPGTVYNNGSLTTLADTTIGIGAILHLPLDANRMALIELNIHYFDSSDVHSEFNSVDHSIECTATPLHKGKSMQVWQSVCNVKSNGKLLNKLCIVRGTALNLYPASTTTTKSNNDNVKIQYNTRELIQEQKELRSNIYQSNKNFISSMSDQKKSRLLSILHDGVSDMMNIELTSSISSGQQSIQTRMRLDEKHMAGTGMVHGGAINSLAETSLRVLCSLLDHNFLQNMNIHFVSSAATIGDELICDITVSETHDGFLIIDATISHNFNPSRATTSGSKQKITAFVRGTAIKNSNGTTHLDSKRLEKLGTGFNIDAMTKTQIRERFDKHSENWIEWTTKFKYFPVFEWIGKNCQQLSQEFKQNAKIFDMATGVGLVAQALQRNEMKGNIMGLDISSGMIQKAMETKCYQQLMVHDLDNDIPFEADFDLLTCCGATEMLQNIDHFLQQVRKVLKTNGEAWITFQYKDSTTSTNPIQHQGMRDYTVEEIYQFFERNGFQVIDHTIAPNAYYLPSPIQRGELVSIPFVMVRACKYK
jgi:ubiquinone/menaquinone biosynthesis C-methylase UbiE/acyl-coenzyme A thioesterase PaaI-like protein